MTLPYMGAVVDGTINYNLHVRQRCIFVFLGVDFE